MTRTATASPHILIVVENLPVPADRRVWTEACCLRDAGYRVSIICPQMHGLITAHEVIDEISIHRYPILFEAVNVGGFLAEYAGALLSQTRLAWHIWRRDRFQAIHICNPPDLVFLVAFPFKCLGVKVVFDSHDLCPEMFAAKFGSRKVLLALSRLAQRLTYATANIVLATNETHRRNAVERGRKAPEKVFLVPTVPGLREVSGIPDVRLKNNRKYLVGYFGVMGSTDGIELILESAAHIVHTLGRHDIQFILLGTGPEAQSLLNTRERLKLNDYVSMPGWGDAAAVATMLRTLDVAVTCDPPNAYSHSCTMNKVLEYMAFGCPQVMFDLTENHAAAGNAAHYVQEYSAKALAEGILRLMDDPAERARLGASAVTTLRDNPLWKNSETELLRAYATLLGGSPVKDAATGK